MIISISQQYGLYFCYDVLPMFSINKIILFSQLYQEIEICPKITHHVQFDKSDTSVSYGKDMCKMLYKYLCHFFQLLILVTHNFVFVFF